MRKAGNRVRVSAQLIEGATGHHVSAERYDRDLEDIFQLQDELTNRIAAVVAPEVSRDAPSHFIHAIALAHAGRLADAAAALNRCEAVPPGFIAKRSAWRPYTDENANKHLQECLEKALSAAGFALGKNDPQLPESAQ